MRRPRLRIRIRTLMIAAAVVAVGFSVINGLLSTWVGVGWLLRENGMMASAAAPVLVAALLLSAVAVGLAIVGFVLLARSIARVRRATRFKAPGLTTIRVPHDPRLPG